MTLLSAQLDLAGGWHDAWRHELRGPHGEWVKGPQALSGVLEQQRKRLGDIRRGSSMPDELKMKIRDAQAAIGQNDLPTAANHLIDVAVDGRISDEDRVAVQEVLHELDNQAAAGREGDRLKDASDSLKPFSGEVGRTERTHYERAMDAIQGGDEIAAVSELRKAMEFAQRKGADRRVEAYKAVIRSFDPTAIPDDKPVTPEIRRISDFMKQNMHVVPKMFGPTSQLYWDGQTPDEYEAVKKPGVYAEIGWSGRMSIEDGVAKRLAGILDHPDQPVDDPDALIVPLHEMVHVVEPEGEHHPLEYRVDDAEAYNEKNSHMRAIEEGFTQLGTAQHAAEFFDAIGVGNRQTPLAKRDANGDPVDNPALADIKAQVRHKVSGIQRRLAADDFPHSSAQAMQVASALSRLKRDLNENDDPISARDELQSLKHSGWPEFSQDARDLDKLITDYEHTPYSEHQNMREVAEDMASGDRIRRMQSWPHYNDWTKDAYDFCAYISVLDNGKEDPETIRWVADQVNMQGTADKATIMAGLIFGTMGYPVGTISSSTMKEAVLAASDVIKYRWQEGRPQATVDLARKAIRQRVTAHGEGAKAAS